MVLVEDRRHRSGVLLGQPEVWRHRLGTLHKQRHRRGAGQRGGREELVQVGQQQRRQRIQPLATDVQRLPAGDQRLQPRTGLQQLHHQRRGCQKMLEVIQHQQLPLSVQRGLERLEQRPAGGFCYS